MKKVLCFILCSVILLTVCSCSKSEYVYSPIEKSGNISVVSFNCAAPWGSYENNTSTRRRVELFAAYMNAVKPDLIGTQEMNSIWMEKLGELMSDYDSYAVKRGGDGNEKSSEMNSVFWLKDKYNCIERNTFWLSASSDTESKFAGAGCNRICTYAVLQELNTGNIIIHMNTHLDNSSAAAREYGANLIILRLNMLLGTYPEAKAIITGDFNDIEGSAPYKTISNVLTSCESVATVKPGNTYQNWGEDADDNGNPIDFIFTNGTPVKYLLLDDLSNGYVSDHYGVYAEID